MDLRSGCRSAATLWSLLALTCAPAPKSASGVEEGRRAEQGAVGTTAAGASAAPDAPVESPATNSADVAGSKAQRELPFSWTRVQQEAVLSFAVGKAPKVAALVNGAVLLFDDATWRRLEAPESAAAGTHVELFFGRDDAPRLLGFSLPKDATAPRPFYQRYKQGRFQPEPSELGPLAATTGRLYGVLGHADPEVVCRQGALCLVKRITGWAKAPAHDSTPRIVLAGDSAFALHADAIERLEGERWVPLTPQRVWREPLGLWLDPSGSPWIIERGHDALVTLINGAWQTIAQPVHEPRALWGNGSNDLWVVGGSGAAHYDGAEFRVADDVSGSLQEIAFSSPHLWLAGESGVFRGDPLTLPISTKP